MLFSKLTRKSFFAIGAMMAVLVLTVVMVFTVLRVQNNAPTISLPRADSSCQTPSCCDQMATGGYDVCDFAQRGQCSPAQCDAAFGKGSHECDTGYRCEKSGKACQGQDSNCDVKSEEKCVEVTTPKCKCGIAYSCTSGGTGGGSTGGGTTGGGTTGGTAGQGCNSSSPGPVWSCYQNGINGVGKGNCTWCWSQYNSGGGGGTTGGSCFDDCFQKGGGNGTACRVGCETDAQCVQECSGSKNKYLKCVMGCIGGDTGGDSCTKDSDCESGKVCADGACTNRTNAHLECVDNACSWTVGSGANSDGCSTVNAKCTPPVESHLVCGTNGTCTRVAGAGSSSCLSEGSACNQVSYCWGNGGKDGRCYDGNGDGEVNILDFSCFAHFWLINISATGNPKCGIRS